MVSFKVKLIHQTQIGGTPESMKTTQYLTKFQSAAKSTYLCMYVYTHSVGMFFQVTRLIIGSVVT